MSWVAAWIEGTNSSGARELNNPTDAQSKMSNLSKCTVRKWAKRIAVIPMSTEDRWAGCQGAKLGNKELEDSVSIWRDGTCVSGPCGYRSRAWLREWGVAAWVCLLPTSRKPELQLGGGGSSVCVPCGHSDWHLWWQFSWITLDQICMYCMSFNVKWMF